MADQQITCCDCGGTFYFTKRDQQFYTENQWAPPKRCKPCREKKKREREAGTGR